MPKTEIANLNLGGLANSLYQGLANSAYRMVGLDIHSEPGVIKVNQKLTKESGSTIDDFVKKQLPCSDGNTYMFGSTSGKIWKRTSAGAYSLEATASPAAGAAGIMDAIEDQGYIYYTMQSRVGRWQIGTAWSTRNDSWATFSITDDKFHPMVKVNLVVYIGDGNYLAQIEDGIFTAKALDIEKPHRIAAVDEIKADTPAIAIGTYTSDNVNNAKALQWNGWSVSFLSADDFPEKAVNSFLKADNLMLVSAGEKGNVYSYDGSKMRRFKRIPGDFTVGKKAKVHNDASVDFYGLPLFGFSNVANNPCLLGVYSFGSYSADYQPVLNLEYVISPDKLASIEIGSIVIVDDYLLVSWKDGSTYGIDKLDSTAKYASAYLETRQMVVDRTTLSKATIMVHYRLLPENTDIHIHTSKNGEAYRTDVELKKDALHKMIGTEVNITEFVTLQVKVLPIVSGNNAPEIESITVVFS